MNLSKIRKHGAVPYYKKKNSYYCTVTDKKVKLSKKEKQELEALMHFNAFDI